MLLALRFVRDRTWTARKASDSVSMSGIGPGVRFGKAADGMTDKGHGNVPGTAGQPAVTPESLAQALDAEQRARRERWQVITALTRAGTNDSEEIALSVAASGLADYGAVAAHIAALHSAAAANRGLAGAGSGLDADYEARPVPLRGEPGRYAGAVLVRRQDSSRDTSLETVAELLRALTAAGLSSVLPSEDAEFLAIEIDFAGIPIAEAERPVRAATAHASTS